MNELCLEKMENIEGGVKDPLLCAGGALYTVGGAALVLFGPIGAIGFGVALVGAYIYSSAC